MTDYDKVQRGIDARELLGARLIVEAFANLERDTVDRIANATRGQDNETIYALAERLRVIRDLKQELVNMSTEGRAVEPRLSGGE